MSEGVENIPPYYITTFRSDMAPTTSDPRKNLSLQNSVRVCSYLIVLRPQVETFQDRKVIINLGEILTASDVKLFMPRLLSLIKQYFSGLFRNKLGIRAGFT